LLCCWLFLIEFGIKFVIELVIEFVTLVLIEVLGNRCCGMVYICIHMWYGVFVIQCVFEPLLSSSHWHVLKFWVFVVVVWSIHYCGIEYLSHLVITYIIYRKNIMVTFEKLFPSFLYLLTCTWWLLVRMYTLLWVTLL